MAPTSIISIDDLRALRAERRRLRSIEDELAALTQEDRQRMLAQMREHVARLHGAHTLSELETTESGVCDECQHAADRWRYGKLSLCLRCTVRRQANRERVQQMKTTGELERPAHG